MAISQDFGDLASPILQVLRTLSIEATSWAAQPVSILATPQFSPGWATFGLVLPAGASKGSVRVGAYPTQTDVKTAWADGSIRFAIVTAKIVASGYYPIASVNAAPPQGWMPVWPTVSATITIGSSLFTASLPPFDGTDTWLAGDLVREARVYVTPTSGGIPHPLLQVLFDVRSYSDGTHRVECVLQNVRDIPAGNSVTCDIALNVNGVQAYTKTGLVVPYMTRPFRKIVKTTGLIESDVVHDFAPFYTAKAIPQYLVTVSSPTPVVTAKFDPGGFGDMSPDMSSPGGRPEIGPYPNWIAQYLVHRTQSQRAYMLASADVSGSWRGHITEPNGKTLVSVDAYPTYWLDGRAGTRTTGWPQGPDAIRQLHNGGPFPGGWSEGIETAHSPSLNYVPYLVTGDRFHLDQMKFWSNAHILMCNRGTNGATGLLSDNQPRGIAWSIRSLGDLAAYIPDADPMASYFRGKLANNLAWLDTLGTTQDGGPFHFLFADRPGFTPADRVTSLWMNNYIAWALERCEQHGFGPVAVLRDRIVRNQLLFFTSDPDWLKSQATYYPTTGRVDAAGKLTYFTTMKQIFDASLAADNRNIGYPGQYGVDARLMLLIGVRSGMLGAQQALDYLMAVNGMVVDVNVRSGWAVQL